MLTEILRIDPKKPEPEKIKYAAEALRKGRLVVFPTETVYGIGANAENKKTLARLRKLKERQKNPFSYHIASKSDFEGLNCIIDKNAKKIIDKFLPGPLTLVLPTKSGKTIGVRMPRHPVALALLKKAGAKIVAPSANFKNESPATNAEQAFYDLNGLVDIIIDSGRTRVGISSTVLEMTEAPYRILRKGSIAREEIEKIAGYSIL
jgi:L-threonylcarbamoyladenylate synthase